MTLKKILTALLLSLCSISFANADTLGFRAGAGIWQPEASGTFRNGGGNIDLKDDLFLDDTADQNYTYMILEHPLPIIPNFKVSTTSLSFEGAGDSTFTYRGNSYTTGITSELVLDHSDVTAYWSFLDNWLNFDLGLTARKFDGYLMVTDGVNTSNSNIDQTVPMIYAAVGLELPFLEGLFIGVEVNTLEFDGTTVKDHTAKISYTTSYLVGFEAGVRTMTVELDDVNSNYSSMEFTGSYASLYIHF